MLSMRQAALWPRPMRLACAALMAVLVAAFACISALTRLVSQLQAAQAAEADARAAYAQARALAAQLPQLRARRQQLAAAVAALEQQLPNHQEMAGLLTSINQAGQARGLQFDLFKPGAPVPQQHYVAMPISLRLRGAYHAIGAFAADLAHLPRIVTVQTLSLAAGKDGAPQMEALLHAYRLPAAGEAPVQPSGKVAPPAVQPRRVPGTAPFIAASYDAAQLPDPFGAPKSVLAAGGGVPAPDLRRVREPLESVSLASLAMVGSVRHGGALDALLQAGPRVYRVAVGQYLGQDHGRVTAIEEQALQYREVLQEAGGAWRERRGSLPLQLAGAPRAASAEPEK